MEFVLYRRRWLVLFAVCMANLSNNMSFMTFSTISSFAVDYYGSAYAPMVLNIVFLACTVVSLYAIHVINKSDGLRISCLICAWLGLGGNCLRAFAASTLCPTLIWLSTDRRVARFWVTLGGQVLLAVASPFGMCLTTKMASAWFPDTQRVVANTLAALSGAIGAVIIYAAVPWIVNTEQPENFFELLSWVTVPAVFAALASVFVQSRPPTPPSASAAALLVEFDDVENSAENRGVLSERDAILNDSAVLGENDPGVESNNDSVVEIDEIVEEEETSRDHQRLFRPRRKVSGVAVLASYLRRELWPVLANPQFLLLSAVMGNGFGVSNSFNTNIQQILCARGFAPELADSLGVVYTAFGIAAALLIGRFLDRTRLFDETLKVLYAVGALYAIAIAVLLQVLEPGGDASRYTLLSLVALNGMVSVPNYPIGLELAMEVTFPVRAEATTSGIVVLMGQLQGIFWLLVITLVRREPPLGSPIWRQQTCHHHENSTIMEITEFGVKSGDFRAGTETTLGVFDWRPSLWAWTALAVGNSLLLFALFRPRYKRIEFERRVLAAEQQKRQNGEEEENEREERADGESENEIMII